MMAEQFKMVQYFLIKSVSCICVWHRKYWRASSSSNSSFPSSLSLPKPRCRPSPTVHLDGEQASCCNCSSTVALYITTSGIWMRREQVKPTWQHPTNLLLCSNHPYYYPPPPNNTLGQTTQSMSSPCQWCKKPLLPHPHDDNQHWCINSRIGSQKLKNPKDNVIDIAERDWEKLVPADKIQPISSKNAITSRWLIVAVWIFFSMYRS